MGRRAGSLLWRRMRLFPTGGVLPNFAPNDSQDIDTGITQVNRNFGDYSPGEPNLGVAASSAPAVHPQTASRVQVVPLAPTVKWAGIVHGEPYFNTVTGTVHVKFTNLGQYYINDLNVLFWDPHSLVGPGQADTYGEPPRE